MSALAPSRFAPWSEKFASPRTYNPGDRAHQVVVHPEAAHRVVDGGVDAHRRFVRVLRGDLVVHVEEVAVLLLDPLLAVPLDRVGEVEIHRLLRRPHAEPLVAHLLCAPRRDVARDQVAERRVHPLEVVVPLGLGDVLRLRASPFAFGTQMRPSLRRLSLISVSFDW